MKKKSKRNGTIDIILLYSILILLYHMVIIEAFTFQRLQTSQYDIKSIKCHDIHSNRINPRTKYIRGTKLHQHEEWEPKKENIKQDFDTLERAYKKHNASNDLQEKQRLFLLDSIYNSKKTFGEWVAQYKYSLLGLFGYVIFLINRRGTGIIFVLKSNFGKFINIGLELQFWTCVIASPILYYMVYERNIFKKSKNNQKSFLSKDKNCDNYISCLLENWISSILGYTILKSILLPISYKVYPSTILTLPIRILNRIGALASLHQYPILNYKLYTLQDRFYLPVSKSIHVFRNICSLMKVTFLASLFGDVSLLVFDTTKTLVFKESFKSMLYGIQSKRQLICYILQSIGILLAILPPILHILSFLKLLKVTRIPNISLGTKNPELNNTSLSTKLYLKWREPKRIKEIIKNWYRVCIIGYVDHSKRSYSIFDSPAHKSPYNKHSILKNSHLPLLRVLASEEEPKKYDRNESITNAMNQMMEYHQESYNDKTFHDPLGIALQQIFNIGLSFDYDHTTPNKEEPSLYRLRARAAKTAIKYIQHLKTNPEILKITNDPNLSQRKKDLILQEYNKNVQSEIDYYKTKLLNSLHATESLPDGISYDDLNVIVSQSTSVRKRNDLEAVFGEAPKFGDDIDEDLLLEYDIVNQFKKNRLNENGEFESSSSEWDYVTTTFDDNKDQKDTIKNNDEDVTKDEEKDENFYFV